MSKTSSSTKNKLSEIPRSISVYSADGGQGDYKISGSVKLMVWYHKWHLYVRVVEAKNLANSEEGYPPSPYIKIWVMPDASKITKRKTKIKIGTSDPVFNECFELYVPTEKIHRKILFLNVWNWDRYGRNLFLGELDIHLSSLNLCDTSEKWYPLRERIYDLQHAGNGELRFALKYEPVNGGCLSVFVHELKYLLHKPFKRNYFVRGLLFPEQIMQKTTCVDKMADPEWKQQLKYHNLTYDDLRTKKVLELSLWNSNGKKYYDFIGCVRLGPTSDKTRTMTWMDSNDLEYCIWSAMLSHPGQWMDAIIELRPTIASYLDYNLQLSSTEENSSIASKETSSSVNQYGFFSHKRILDVYTITGRVLLKLEFSKGSLTWHILKAENLAAVVSGKLSNPYVIISLVCGDDILHKWKSKVRMKTLNPVYYEFFKFKIEDHLMASCKLKISLWHFEKYEEEKTLGNFEINLLKFKSWGTPHWYSLEEEKKITEEENITSHGNLTLSLKFEEWDNVRDYIYGTLHMYVNNARGIPHDDGDSKSFCYVVVSSMSFLQPQHTEKVLLQKGSPVWRHQFSFTNLSFDNLCYETCVEVTVRKEQNGKMSLIGGLRFGPAPIPGYTSKYMDSCMLEANHWDHMLSHAGEWVECTHALRATMRARKLNDVKLPATVRVLSTISSESMENSVGKLVVTAMFERMNRKFRLKGNLYVKIKEAQQLKCRKDTGIFAVCKLSPHFHWEWKNNSTEVVKNSTNPTFDKVFLFENIFQDDLQLRRVLNITVFEDNGSPPFVYIGRLCLGSDPENSISAEVLHWEEILKNPGQWVENIHSLRY